MYYVIDTYDPYDEDDESTWGFMEIHEEIRVPGILSWCVGRAFDTNPPNPIIVETTPRHGYEGLPPDYFDGNIALMSKKLVNVLTGAGVDNIDLYPAILKNTVTGEEYPYYAFNLIGLVSAVDFGASDISSFDGDFIADSSIRGFTVDETKIHGLLMFRLTENLGTVLVHEKVKKAIEENGFDSIEFIEPQNWVQL